MSAIEKMVEILKKSGYEPQDYELKMAMRLQAEEQAQKPTAPASLVEELEVLYDSVLRNTDNKLALKVADDMFKIFSRYTLQEEKPAVDGNTSDGYHTFNELYDHRIALYLDIVAQNSEWFWKSKKHEDGSEFKGWFILGGNMGTGDISYHLPMDKWELAKCKELPFGKKWDGHMPKDVVERITRHSQAPNTSRPAANADMVAQLEAYCQLASPWINGSAEYADGMHQAKRDIEGIIKSCPVKANDEGGLVKEFKAFCDNYIEAAETEWEKTENQTDLAAATVAKIMLNKLQDLSRHNAKARGEK